VLVFNIFLLLENMFIQLPICRKHKLAIAMKFGAERGLNPALESAGDGVRVVDIRPLINLCKNNPQVKFLATFLSRVNQHELCVVANKFRNLHIYGCWWYCNNPSIISEMTQMRIEILGTAFTAQHSDARVLDQIVYKWKHSKAVVGQVLAEQYVKLYGTGWKTTLSDVKRDVWRLFGGAYEEFLKK